MVRTIFALAAVLTFAQNAAAQQSHVELGGAVNLVTQTHSDDQPLGGTALGGSVLFGVRAAPRLSIEFEPSFGDSFSSQYTYRPFASAVATVVPTRRDTFFPIQARLRAGVLEPVVGLAIVHSTIERHATFENGTTYFDDSRSGNDLGVVGGLDAAFKLGSSVYLVPTFRVLIGSHGSNAPGDSLGEQTSTGTFTFKCGVGARVEF